MINEKNKTAYLFGAQDYWHPGSTLLELKGNNN